LSDPDFEQRELEAAEREAAEIGGHVDPESADPAMRAVLEGGGGEAEGFEEAERELIEHASHGDDEPAHVVLHDQGQVEEDQSVRADGEADHEPSSESESE